MRVGEQDMSPYFVRDYRALAADMLATKTRDEAMGLIVGGGDYETMGAIQAGMLTNIGFGAGHSLVDVGCGSGRLARRLTATYGDKIDYLGIDVVPEMLAYAKEHACPRYRFVLTERCAIAADDASADFVIAMSVFTHLRKNDVAQYLREIGRVLRPGGKLLFSFLELPYHARIFAIAKLMQMGVIRRFPEVHFQSRRWLINECTKHSMELVRFAPPQRFGICLRRNYYHSCALFARR